MTDSIAQIDGIGRLNVLMTENKNKDATLERIVKQSFDEPTVKKVIRLVDQSEYKRRQRAPCVKITPRAFGKDRRMPITNRYRF